MNSKICIIGRIDERLRLVIDLSNSNLIEADISHCDYAVYGAILWDDPATEGILKQLNDHASTFRKKLLVFVVSDFEYRYPMLDWVFIFRTSLRASLIRKNEYVLPYIWETDPQPFPVLRSCQRPIIGFCGLATESRRSILDHFARDTEVQTNFILRDEFWGGDPHNPLLVDDFRTNMKSSHFIVSNRAAGNFSMRFYQTLAAGRIPIMIDTDVLLPFDDEIDWESSIVIGKTVRDLSSIIKNLNDKCLVEEFQNRCQNIFEQYFRKNCFSSLERRIENTKGKRREYHTKKF